MVLSKEELINSPPPMDCAVDAVVLVIDVVDVVDAVVVVVDVVDVVDAAATTMSEVIHPVCPLYTARHAPVCM